MQEDNKSPDNSQNQAFTGKTLIAGGGGAIIGSIASWASVNAINDFFSKNASEPLAQAAEIKTKNGDYATATKAWIYAKKGLTNPEAIAIATTVCFGVAFLTGLAIHTLIA
jgi:hypothetical protein